MTFAENLKYKADVLEMDLNVHTEMCTIEKNMEKHFNLRKYVIEVVDPKGTIAIGGNCTTRSQFFVPYGVSPQHYRQLFVDELHKLGFTDENIEFSDFDCKFYTSYKIIVRW